MLLSESSKKASWYLKFMLHQGTAEFPADAECVNIKPTDIDAMIDFAVKNIKLNLQWLHRMIRLVLGMVDAFEKAGIKTFGPNKAAAILEGSKVFC